MSRPSAKPNELTVSFLLKRGTLLGAALGMLVGLISLSIIGGEPSANVANIVFWRNSILIGAAGGFLLGSAAAWWFRDRLASRDPHK